MCETALCFACNRLLPLARDHLLPFLLAAANAIRVVPEEVADMKAGLRRIEDVINDAETIAKAEEDNTSDGIKTKVNELREAAFLIEDVIDHYMICVGQQPHDPGCAAAAGHLVETTSLVFRIAYKIQNIKTRIAGLQIQASLEQGPSSSTANRNPTFVNLRMAPFRMKEADVVGFKAPQDKLIDWLVKGKKERTVISVVGMGGVGKTTLAKKVFDSKEVAEHFDCHAWITVSQSYTVEGSLRTMLGEFYKQKGDDPPQCDERSLADKVSNYLQDKRYVIVFDDVWNEHFWDEFEFALIDNNIGSRIFITTRNMDVAMFCKRSSIVQVQDLRPLDLDKSLELFNKKAFFDLDGRCPQDFVNVSSEIVEKCSGLPLAIVAIGGFLAAKPHLHQWISFFRNLSSELDNNTHLTAVTKILGSSFHDLDYNLKRCLLYFGIYPEDCEVKTVGLIQRWVAEGFVEDETGNATEEVAETYLTKLIYRSLVQVSSVASDGKIRSCRVHPLIRHMILGKIQDLSFCHFASKNEDQSVQMIRRREIATGFNNLMASVECPSIRSLHVFTNEELKDSIVTNIPSRYRLLKVLVFEDVPQFNCVPNNLGDLFLLRYLSFRNTKVTDLPESIGMLLNLETLDIRQTMVRKMPSEIKRLTKLRHILAYDKSKGVGHGIQMQDGIGDVASLQTLCEVEADPGGDKLITELEKLKQLRKLGLTNFRQEYTSSLRSSVKGMEDLEKLCIAAISKHEAIDLEFDKANESVPKFRKLRLIGKLDRFPHWVRELQNLVKLSLSHSMLTHDPLTSLKDLPNLMYLNILYHAYEGESLQFPDEGLQKLKELELRRLSNLNSITIGKGALSSLEMIKLVNIPQLKEVPSGVHNLPKLQVFQITNMPNEFTQSIDRVRGQKGWITEQVPIARKVDPFWA